MKINPLGERVLVKISAVEQRTTSGLFIPQTAQEKVHNGIVIERGDIRTIETGDKVIYDKYAGTPIKIDDENHLIIDIKDIIAMIEE
jgi:chaperonin GroES